MLQISEVYIISIDKSEDNWAIEGEILFEEDLSSAFAATYIKDDDEFDDFSMELELEGFDIEKLKEMIISAAITYEDDF